TGGVSTGSLYFGNAESGTSTGNTDFERILIDYLNGATPLGPVGISNYWIQKWGGDTNSASGGGLPATVSNVAVGDLIVVMVKFESTTTTCTMSDGTSTLTQSSVGVQNNPGANGEPHLVVFYLLSSVASGTVTYTPTLGANKTWRSTIAFALTPPPG